MKSLRRITFAFLAVFSHVIRLPTVSEQHDMALANEKKWGIPDCVACMDGTGVRAYGVRMLR